MSTKTKVILIAFACIIAIILVSYLFSTFQLQLEQAFGKFVTTILIYLLIFSAGWCVGRFGGKKKSDKKE